MGPAECGQKVVECHLVRHINGSELKTPLVVVTPKIVIVSDRDIKQMTRSNSPVCSPVPEINLVTQEWQLTGPNLFAPLFLAKRIRIKQFGRLIST